MAACQAEAATPISLNRSARSHGAFIREACRPSLISMAIEMPVRRTAEPFTWQSAAPHARWRRGTRVAVLCALFAAGGYSLSRTVAAPDWRPLDRTATDRSAATAVSAQKERDNRGEGRIAKLAHKKKSVITKKPNRPVDEDIGSARTYANHPRLAVPRPSLANDDFRYEPRRYRDYRDLRGSMLRGG